MPFILKRVYFILLLYLFAFQALAQPCNPVANISASPTGEVCKGQTITFTGSATDAGNNPTYIWYNGKDTIFSNTYTDAFQQDQPIYLAVISSSPCTPIDTVYTFYQVNVTEITIDYSETNVRCGSNKADVEITSTNGGIFPYTYNLDSVDQGDNNQFNNLAVGQHIVVVTDGNGCKDTNYINIPEPFCENPIPVQAFTPNGDGYNDTWVIGLIENYPNNKVYIYDRWGQRVYYKEGYTNADGWDATYAGVPLAVSTYYYIIYLGVENENGEERFLKGPVSIFR
jgi:gliding motility-associated-like protein